MNHETITEDTGRGFHRMPQGILRKRPNDGPKVKGLIDAPSHPGHVQGTAVSLEPYSLRRQRAELILGMSVTRASAQLAADEAEWKAGRDAAKAAARTR